MNYLTADLPHLIHAANTVAGDVKMAFGTLSSVQLNWKPSSDRWSVAQCFDHLITTNQGYIPIIENVLAGQKRTFWQGMPLVPRLAGRLLIKSLDPASTRKLKAPKAFQPTQSDIRPSVIGDFVESQHQVIEKMMATKHLPLEQIVISSPIAAAITYSLLDAYRIILAHEHRHFQQAKRVTEEQTFPG